MKPRPRCPVVAALCASGLAVVLLPRLTFAQGSLTPPASPGPTMKTLDQIDAKLEKRTPISSLPYTISAPGSYYLTRNLTATGSSAGITISADNVTVDLDGFALIGGGGGTVAGISMPGMQKNACIRNGTIRSWTNGGLRAFSTANCFYEKLRISDNTGGNAIAGVLIGSRSTIRDCVATKNSGPGFQSAEICTVTACTASNNSAEGFSLGNAVTVTNCAASGNATYGIKVGEDSVVAHCTADNNSTIVGYHGIRAEFGATVKDCSTGHNSHGIRVAFGSTVVNCTARANAGIGIEVTDSCQITNNTVDANRNGITLGSGSRVEANNATGNTFFVFLVNGGGHNLVIRNSARANGSDNYSLAASDAFGAIVDRSGGCVISTSDPWANFSF
jgi:parallel beta-helix repeat protein